MLRSAEGFIFQCYFQFRRKTVWKHLNIFCGMRNCFNYQLIIFFLMKLLYYRKLKMSRKVHVFIADESSQHTCTSIHTYKQTDKDKKEQIQLCT